MRKISLIYCIICLAFSILQAHNHFIPVESTGLPYHVIISDIIIDGSYVQDGTEIGIFDDTLCVGSGIITEDNQQNIDVVTWQKNRTYNLDGFTNGDSIIIKLWLQLKGEWVEIIPNTEYSTGNGTFGYGSFSTISLSFITEIYTLVEVTPQYLNFGSAHVGDTLFQQIKISNFGNRELEIISISSDNPSFQIISDFVEIIVPDDSQFIKISFTPDSLIQENGILTIQSNDNKNQTVEVTMIGQGIPQETPIIFTSSDNIDFGVVHVGDTVIQNLDIFNIGGEVLNIIDITIPGSIFYTNKKDLLILPGESYSLKIFSAPISNGFSEQNLQIFSNASNDTISLVNLTVSGYSGHFQPVTSTGLPYIILVNSIEIDDEKISPGSEVAIFDGDLCVGSSIYVGEFPIQLTAWRGNSEKGLAGFSSGNQMIFKVFTMVNKEMREIIVNCEYEKGDGTFGTDIYSVVSLFTEPASINRNNVSDDFELVSAYPNPFNDNINFSINIGKSKFLSINIFSIKGERVFSDIYNNIHPGKYFLSWDGRSNDGSILSSGVFFVMFSGSNKVEYKKILYLK